MQRSRDKDLNPVPDLVKRWDVSPDGLVYTFYLQEGVQFHDGTDMDAQARRSPWSP